MIMSLDVNNPEFFALASIALATSIDEVRENKVYIPEIGGYYFWETSDEGSSLIFTSEGELLYKLPLVGLKTHLEAFLAGQRTNPEDLD